MDTVDRATMARDGGGTPPGADTRAAGHPATSAGPAPDLPAGIADVLEALAMAADRTERIQMLIDIGRGFTDVPPDIATRPFPEDRRVPACESEAFVWARPRTDGTLDFFFAVENPQGISARALAAVLQAGASGAPLEQVAALDASLAYRIFGNELSMGKSMGLGGMVAMVRQYAQQALGRPVDPIAPAAPRDGPPRPPACE